MCIQYTCSTITFFESTQAFGYTYLYTTCSRCTPVTRRLHLRRCSMRIQYVVYVIVTYYTVLILFCVLINTVRVIVLRKGTIMHEVIVFVYT